MLKKAAYELVQQFYHASEIGYVAIAVALALIRLNRQNKDNCFE